MLLDPEYNILEDPVMTPADPGSALDDNGSSVNAGHYGPSVISDDNAVALPQPDFAPSIHWVSPYELATHDVCGLVPGWQCVHSLITQDDFNEGQLNFMPYSSTTFLHERADQFRNDLTLPLPHRAA